MSRQHGNLCSAVGLKWVPDIVSTKGKCELGVSGDNNAFYRAAGITSASYARHRGSRCKLHRQRQEGAIRACLLPLHLRASRGVHRGDRAG